MKIHIKLILTLISIITIHSSYSQDRYTAAKNAQKYFPDESFVGTESITTLDFKYNKKKNKICAYETINDKYICIKKSQQFLYAIFYDSYSSVYDFEIANSENRHVSIEYDNYKSKDIFHSDQKLASGSFNVNQYATTIEVIAKKEYTDLKYLTSIYFTKPYSNLTRTIKVTIPRNIDLEIVQMNFNDNDITTSTTEENNNLIHTFTLDSAECYADHSGLPGNSHIYPHLLLRVKSIKHKDKETKLFDSVDELYAWYRTLINEIDNQPDSLQTLVDKLCSNKTNDIDKVKSIFYWVQDNIKYIAFEDGIAGYKPESCQRVYSDRYGDCKGMGNLCKQMLTLAGLDARLAWLGTRKLAYDYSKPSLASDNHMICALRLNDEFIYLDATEKYISLGDYAERIQGRQVLIEDGDSYLLNEIPTKTIDQNYKNYTLKLKMNEKLELTGKAEISLTGEAKASYMSYINNTETNKKNEAIKNDLAFYNKLIKIVNISGLILDQNIDTLKLSGNIIINDKASNFEDETYVYINPYLLYEKFKFDKERKFAYWFSHKKNNNVNIQFTIPDEYELKFIPEKVDIDNDEYSFNIDYNLKNNIISYKLQIQIPDAKISKSNLKEWNKSITELNEAYDQPLILKKK